jgi:hypothetical protein
MAPLSKEIIKCLDEVMKRNLESSRMDEARPQLSIFYVVDGRDYVALPMPVKDLKSMGGTVSYPATHGDYWKRIVQHHRPDLKNVHFAFYPRGRVMFEESTEKYTIFVDECIPDKIMDEIRSELGLSSGPYGNSKTIVGGHYQCAGCNPKGYNKLHNIS